MWEMLALTRASAVLFAFSVALSAAALSALVVLIFASVAKPSETVVGVGVFWVMSLPALVLLAGSTVLLFPRYARRDGFSAQLSFYVPIVVLVACAAPILTYLGFPLAARLWW